MCRVYGAAALQRVDQIRYNTLSTYDGIMDFKVGVT
jgi:hypothetical protein